MADSERFPSEVHSSDLPNGVIFRNPEFIYIFTIDIGGYIKLKQEPSDLGNFILLELRREEPDRESREGELSDKIIEEKFFKKTVLGKWKAKDQFINELEGLIMDNEMGEITFWRPETFLNIPPILGTNPFGSIEIKLFRTGVLSILIRFATGDLNKIVEMSSREILDLIKYPDNLSNTGKLNLFARRVARRVFTQFQKDFENQYDGMLEIMNFGKADFPEKYTIRNKFSFDWADVDYYVCTLIPNPPDDPSPEVLNTYVAVAKTTPHYVLGFGQSAQSYLNNANISTGNHYIIIEERSMLVSTGRLYSEPWTFRARILENIIFSLEATFVNGTVIKWFTDNLDIIKRRMNFKLENTITEFANTKSSKLLTDCMNTFSFYLSQTRRLSPFEDEISNLYVRVSSDTLKKAIDKIYKKKIEALARIAEDNLSDLNNFLQRGFDFISNFLASHTLRSIDRLTIVVILVNAFVLFIALVMR
jgi:hypothetical protein